MLVNLSRWPSNRYRAAMGSHLRTAVEKVSAVGRDEPGWDAAVARAVRLIEPQWLRKGWEYRRHLALQTLALILFALDRDEQLDDPATLTALTPYVHTPRFEAFGVDCLRTADAVSATRALFAERLPDDGGPLSHLATSLTTPQEVLVTMDLPSMETPDFRAPLAPLWSGSTTRSRQGHRLPRRGEPAGTGAQRQAGQRHSVGSRGSCTEEMDASAGVMVRR
ncbi:hypothetical protein M2271_002150 [Streptomyces sp. LBL]|uniref:hypothetical protein n=1 Tax=Streptomyces sp. LBL TaxID=2940562 RepID=UPI0024747445|nr:hypothetical protein [Streptomyces sp. LBL]MDH6624348.1 hypothetical protein [Streptomyces sp. LBL]